MQQAIPIQRIWEDGIFLVGREKYSKSYKFSDINYAVASRDDKKGMFLDYSELLNSFDSQATTKITVMLRKINKTELENQIFIEYKNDSLDEFRREYNGVLARKIADSDHLVRETYITVSVCKKSIDEARTYFLRIGADLTAHFAKLGSKCKELDANERLCILHNFYRNNEEENFYFDLKESMKRGHDFKDFIAPDSFEFEKNHFKIGNRFGRALFLREFASYIKDSMIAELSAQNRGFMLSIDVIPVPTDEAVREVEKQLLGVETNIANWQRRQNSNNNFSATVPYDLEQQRKESKEFSDDLTNRDQRMMLAVVTIVHTADTLEQLNSDTDAIITTARKHLCQISTLSFQQMDALNTALPVGVRKIDALRTLTTESLAVLMPFRVQKIFDRGGIYFGENAISHNLTMCDKAKLMNPNAFLLGVPGSGKSFSAKELITFLALATNNDILICDPEREYAALVEAMGGVVFRIAAGSSDHINALDMVKGYGDGGNPVIDKSEFVFSLFEQINQNGLGAKEKSIIDRCTFYIYEDFRITKQVPTLVRLCKKLLQQPESEAKNLDLSLEIFTQGSFDAFAHPTNVDVQNRMIVYDIFDLGKQLKTAGLLVITDAMINRVTKNWQNGKRTHIFVDEFHVLFENEYFGNFFNSAWRRFRKRNAFPTAITQNVEYLLDSVLANTMLSNSEFIVMLNQAASNREKLAKLLNIFSEQMSYITNAEAGSGLIRYGSSLVPFVNKFNENTRLYSLMNTRPK